MLDTSRVLRSLERCHSASHFAITYPTLF